MASTASEHNNESVNNDNDNDNASSSLNKSNTHKTVYLIRHAESEENRRLASLKSVGRSLAGFSFPTSQDVGASLQLINIPGQVNTSVSDSGHQQIANVAQQLAETDFWKTYNIDLVAYSPLQRARDTAAGLLNCRNHVVVPESNHHDSSTTTTLDDSVTARILHAEWPQRVVELEDLLEKTPSEWIPGNSGSMWRRIASLERWLAEQPETSIVCVGHSQFFKNMLQLDFKFGNCDVWQAQLDVHLVLGANQDGNNSTTISRGEKHKEGNGTSAEYPNLPPQWSNLKRLYQIVPDKENKGEVVSGSLPTMLPPDDTNELGKEESSKPNSDL